MSEDTLFISDTVKHRMDFCVGDFTISYDGGTIRIYDTECDHECPPAFCIQMDLEEWRMATKMINVMEDV